jgi:two-component system sensor histidine kinase CpxA
MNLGRSLSLKIMLIAALNIVLLVCTILAFAHFAFRIYVGMLLLGPTLDRVLSVSRLIALELPNHPKRAWTQVLDHFSAQYPAQFFLFERSGEELAGAHTQLPPEMSAFVQSGPGKPGPPHERKVGGAERHGRTPEFKVMRYQGAYLLGVHVPVWEEPGQHPPISCTLLWKCSSFWSNTFFFDYRPWLFCVLCVVALSVFCWAPLIRGITQTVSAMTAATAQIAEGRFDVSLPVKRRDELGALSHSINRMSERLASYVHGQKRFLGDIAHELCTPVARIQMALGILRQKAADDSRPYVEDLEEEIEHMSSLVNELLSFSKAEIHDTARELTPVNVADTVKIVLEREGSGAISIESKCPDNLFVLAQPEYLFRSIANLVRNAIRYAAPGGPIEIAALPAGPEVLITVSDHGPGVPEADLENILKPFYRPEFARQRETGGTGLGLAIVKSCVEACGGVVRCRNRQPHGLQVEIRLPAVT